MSTLWLLRILGGLPAVSAPILWFGGLFAFLAEGITTAQRMYVLAGMAYPLFYVACFIVSMGFVRSGDVTTAQWIMAAALGYLAIVLVLWPVLGLK